MKRGLLPKVYNFKCSCELANFAITKGTSFSSKAYNFTLTNLPTNAEYAALFDQYRIRAVKVTFYPCITTAIIGSTLVTQPVGEFYSIVDYDSSDAPSSVNAFLQYNTLKRTFFSRPHTRYFRPSPVVRGVVDGDQTYASFASLNRYTWIDMANRDVRYFGLSVGYSISESSLVEAQLIRCTATYYLQCKACR